MKKKVHFIGIGGIGISAIARFLNEKKFEISGSDVKHSKILCELEKEGMNIHTPHSCDNITNQDFVVYSAAIKPDNVELVQARNLGIKCYSRKEILPYILKDKKVFSVAGAHGKSTTSSMLASILDGSVIIGAISKQFNSNMKYVESDNIIFEADESDSSFLNSNPYLAIVTNAEPEHMEHYDFDIDKFHAAYKGFLERSKIRVINAEDEFLKTVKNDAIKLYPSIDITDVCIVLKDWEPYISFNLKNLGKFEVFGLGEHIAIDASLAILAANCEIGLEIIRQRLKNYKGIKKRFDILYASKNFVLVDDYGHHPTEIKATLKSAKQYANLLGIKRIIAIFQPHRFSRLKANLNEFKECFTDVDELVILPVFSAGEIDNGINLQEEFKHLSPMFAQYVKRNIDSVELFDQFNVRHIFDEGLVIGFGAGDITNQLRGEFN